MSFQSPIVTATAYIVAAQFFVSVLAALIKAASSDLPLEMLVFFRNLFSLLILIPFLKKVGVFGLKTSTPGWHFLRAFFGLFTMYSFFYVVGQLKLANAQAIFMLSPVMVPIAANLILSERLSVGIIVASLIGFIGVCAVLQPEVGVSIAGIVGIVGSLFSALTKVSIRKLSLTEPAYRIVFYYTCTALVISAIPLSWAWQTPNGIQQWALLFGLGLAATASQLCLARGFAKASASRGSIFIYTSILFSTGFGWLFWNETWHLTSLFGALLIIAAGVIVMNEKRSST